jgi:hypothetical protein
MEDELYPEDYIDPDVLDEREAIIEEFSQKEAEYFASICNDVEPLLEMNLPDLRDYIFKS